MSYDKTNTKNSTINGVGCTVLVEPIPSFNIAACETVIEGQNNAYIVLGRDRPGDIFSGYGGKGAKRSGAIDIVVGRTSAIVKEQNNNNEKVLTNPSIPTDAARLSLSQRSDVDTNFYLPDGKIGNRKNKSSATLKADNVRLVAREGGKLVANNDIFDSNGEQKILRFGWDIMATDGKNIQPIPKGENLSQCLDDVYEKIAGMGSEIANLYRIIIHLCSILSLHTHPTSFGPSGPSIELPAVISQIASESGLHVAEQQQYQALIAKSKFEFLQILGNKYINSLYNNVD